MSLWDRERCHQLLQEDTHSPECLAAGGKSTETAMGWFLQDATGSAVGQGRHVPDHSQQKAELNAAGWLGAGIQHRGGDNPEAEIAKEG